MTRAILCILDSFGIGGALWGLMAGGAMLLLARWRAAP